MSRTVIRVLHRHPVLVGLLLVGLLACGAELIDGDQMDRWHGVGP